MADWPGFRRLPPRQTPLYRAGVGAARVLSSPLGRQLASTGVATVGSSFGAGYAARSFQTPPSEMRTRSGKRYLRSSPSGRPKSRRRLFSPRKPSTGVGVTNQYDRTTIYRARRSFRRRRRLSRRGRFTRRVRSTITRELGSRTVVFNKSITVQQASATTANGLFTAGLFCNNSSGNTELSDLNAIATSENLNAGAQKTGRLLFMSGVLDITFQNASFVTGPSSAGTLEIDVYEITAKKYLRFTGSSLSNLTSAFDQGQANCLAVGGAPLASLLTIEGIGVTPWDIPEAITEWGLKIWSKKKYVLQINQVATYQMRTRPMRTIDRQSIIDKSDMGPNMPGLTRFVYFVFKLTPTDRAAGGATARLDFGITRKYLYKKFEQEGDYGSVATL